MSSSPEILAITCPSGKQARHLIPLLLQQSTRPFHLRLGAHTPSSAALLHQLYPSAETVVTDLLSLASCRALLRGAAAIYNVGPSFHSREMDMGFNVVDAVVDAAAAETRRLGNVFQHFVYASVLCTQHRNLVHHHLKARVEERLFVSPLRFTVLQPCNFMGMWPVGELAAQAQAARNLDGTGKIVFERLWNADAANSLIAIPDLAAVAAKVLVEREPHYLAQYPLCGTMPLSEREVARVIGEAIGAEIELGSPGLEDSVRKVLGHMGLAEGEYADGVEEGDVRPDIARDTIERFILYSNRRGLRGNPGVMWWLLGREPMGVEAWSRG